MEIPINNIDNIDELRERLNPININYDEMKESIKDVLDTNYVELLISSRIYDNIFILDKPKKPNKYRLQRYNNYFNLIEFVGNDCNNELQMTEDAFLQEILTNNFSVFNLIRQNVNLEFVNKHISFNEIKKNDNDDFLDTIKTLLATGCTGDLPSKIITNFESLFKLSSAAKYALFIKIIVLYVNPNIDSNLITNENIPYLTLLDLIPDITDEEKKIMLNIIKITLIFYSTKKNRYDKKLLTIPYILNNTELIIKLMNNISDVRLQLIQLLNIIDLGYISKISNSITLEKLLNIVPLDVDHAYGKIYFINLLMGDYVIFNKSEKKKHMIEQYYNFFDIHADDFDPNDLDDIKRIINPILLTNYKESFLDNFFDAFYNVGVNEFSNIIKSETPHDRRINIKNLFKLNTDGEINVNIKLETKYNIVNIDTESDIDADSVFNKTDSELSCKTEKEKYTNVLNISKQFFENSVLTPSHIPYFVEREIKFTGYGMEQGFTTGPTKQIIYNYSELMNYIIKFDEKTDSISYTTPVWAKNNEKLFYTFLTHYIITDLELSASKLNFYLKFNMLVPSLIEILTKYNHLYDNNPDANIEIFERFNKFMKVRSVRGLFYNDDNSKKFENIPEDYDLYYKSISLFMIGDILDGGSEYKYFEYNIDPENEYLQTKLETFTPPSGFFDLNSFILFPYFERLKNITLVNNIFKFMYSFYVILNENKSITAELFISKINFVNESRDEYSVIFDYMKQLITDYTVNLPDEFVKSIKEQYATQSIFNEKLLLAWTASLNITKDTQISLTVMEQPDIQLSTCFNYMGYPVGRGDYVEITYEDFVNTILGTIIGTGFGRKGGRKTIKKHKHQKSIRNKKNIRKKKKSSIKHKKKKRRTIKNV